MHWQGVIAGNPPDRIGYPAGSGTFERLVSMSRLEELRAAEEQAAEVLERARREAQRIRLSIPDALEEMDSRKDGKLAEVADRADRAVEEEMGRLADRLEGRTRERLEELEGHRGDVESRAAELLEAHLLRDGAGDTDGEGD